MTDPSPNPAPDVEADVYSKDYWDLFFEQMGRRVVVKVALAVLVFLYALAIYAPLIANARPYMITAADYQSYGAALRTLAPISAQLGSLVEIDPARYLATLSDASTLTHAEALSNEAEAARLRIQTLKDALPADHHADLDALLADIDAGVAASLATDPAAATHASSIARRGKALQQSHAPADPQDPDSGGLTLVMQTQFPLPRSLGGIDVFFMLAWGALLLWPVWNPWFNRRVLGGDRERIRGARRRKWVWAIGASAVMGLLWQVAVYEPTEEASIKAGLSSGDIVAERAFFPPIAFGFAETHMAEIFRPPTWLAESEMDENGYYTVGFRVPKADPVTGYLPPATPVDRRYGEPRLNAASRHPLGTDGAGRDLLVRMLWGGRVSLAVGIIIALMVAVIGTVVGAMAGFFGGRVDMVLSRIIDVIISVPSLYLIVMAAAFVDPDVLPPIFAIVLIIGLVRWTGIARLTRAEFLRMRESEFVLASQALGDSAARTMFRHVLPNAVGPILVATAFMVAGGILTESAVSFLGFGIQHPMPSWGALINESKSADHWWVQVFPGLMIFLTVTCYNLVGEGIRDATDPKMKILR